MRYSWFLASVLVLAGCTTLPPAPYQQVRGVPEHVALQVPFYAQQTNQCGPAALAMVFAFEGHAVSPDQLSTAVYLPGKQGTLQVEMLAESRRAGLVPYVLDDEPDALLKELAAGHPVIVLQNLGNRVLPDWHYAVVTGYDLPGQMVFLHSGSESRLVTTFDAFDRSWSQSGRWGFVALPPTQLPVTAEETNYVKSVIELEPISPASAAIAYQTALTKWPQDLLARIGAGNAAYAAHDDEKAESEYRQAVADHPDSGDAWNNLAQVLSDLGHNREALKCAKHAVSIGGPRQAEYQATLKSIEHVQ